MVSYASVIPIVTRISSSIIRILGCNPSAMTLQGTNTYLLGKGKSRILLDTGDENKQMYIDNLKDVLKQENAQIDTILLTHWHHDHIGGVKSVLELIGNKDCKVWKYPRTDALDVYAELPSGLELHKLKNGQEFCTDGVTLKIIHTPGHTTDHVVLTMKENQSLFSGDCILGEGTTVFEDLYDYMKSLQIILDNKPIVIYPGHGNIINDPIERIQYYIDHRISREMQIFDVLKNEPDRMFTEMDIVRIVYKDTPESLHLAAAYNVTHHLTKLAKENRIRKISEEDSIPIATATIDSTGNDSDGIAFSKWQFKNNITSML